MRFPSKSNFHWNDNTAQRFEYGNGKGKKKKKGEPKAGGYLAAELEVWKAKNPK